MQSLSITRAAVFRYDQLAFNLIGNNIPPLSETKLSIPEKTLHIASVNVSSLSTVKLDTLIDFMELNQVDILLMQECRTTPQQIHVIRNHIARRKVNLKFKCTLVEKKASASGVACLYKKNLYLIEIPIQIADPELKQRIQILDIQIDQGWWRIINVYFPANEEQESTLAREALQSLLTDIIEASKRTNTNYIVMGDFNACLSEKGRVATIYIRRTQNSKNGLSVISYTNAY